MGFEALVRWESPERGLVPPDEFIPLFERTGLVVDLDLQVFRLVCARIREQLDAGEHPLVIACNFSRLHMQNDAFPETVKSIVDGFGVPIELLELELTENIVMEDLERAERLCRRLKDLGFRIAIDDFGSGYSSLGTLQNLPIDVLKLDRSFLMSSESGERCKAILDGVVSIADKLAVNVVVEGVETRDQACPCSCAGTLASSRRGSSTPAPSPGTSRTRSSPSASSSRTNARSGHAVAGTRNGGGRSRGRPRRRYAFSDA